MRTALIYVGGTVWGSTTRTTKGTPQGGRWWSFGDDWFKSTPRGRCCAGYSRRIFEVGAKELTLSTVQPRVDSTLVCSNMAKRDRLSLTRETLRVFIRSLNEAQHVTLPAEVQAWPRADTDTDSLAQRGGRRGAEATEGKRIRWRPYVERWRLAKVACTPRAFDNQVHVLDRTNDLQRCSASSFLITDRRTAARG